MRTVAASDFSRNFGKYQDEAISAGVINVTSHGRVVGAYLSAAELEHFDELKRRERKVLKVGELDEQTLADIEAAEYDVEPK
ncbi:type II toxin-antitoxin system prevent-host-death family antitoxin [Roseibium sp.]|uniref:type II toxin-antitoxin system prevent-host-death family antitoxin n=1 Tax=Roseibium sp. TaxID=1936156 RepID=UPI003D14E913